jgi:hypothetical protein
MARDPVNEVAIKYFRYLLSIDVENSYHGLPLLHALDTRRAGTMMLDRHLMAIFLLLMVKCLSKLGHLFCVECPINTVRQIICSQKFNTTRLVTTVFLRVASANSALPNSRNHVNQHFCDY